MRFTLLLAALAATVLVVPTAFAEDAGPVSVNVNDCSNNVVAVSVHGCAQGIVAVSAFGSAWNHGVGVAASGTDFASSRGGAAASGTGDAAGNAAGVSGTSKGSGTVAVGFAGARAIYLAASAVGDETHANWLAVSATGDPDGGLAGVSGTGHASAYGAAAVSGCSASGGIVTVSPATGVSASGFTVLTPLPASACP